MNVNLCLDELQPVVERAFEKMFLRFVGLREACIESSRLLTENEAAQSLGVNRHVLRDARLRGEIEFVRVGKSANYERKHLEAFKQKQLNRQIGA